MRGARALTAAALLSGVTGCAHARTPDLRPAPPARVQAHLDVIPPITIAGHAVMLVAWLDDPEAVVRCPTIEWTWPDGTRSSHTSDCDPDERVTRHQDIRHGTAYPGEHHFAVRFASAGREWRAQAVLPVPGQ